MKGKLSRVWRSGLSMLMAIIMMFSLGTAAFAVEIDTDDMLNYYNVAVDTVEKVKYVADKATAILEASEDFQKLKSSEYVDELKAILEKLIGILSGK